MTGASIVLILFRITLVFALVSQQRTIARNKDLTAPKSKLAENEPTPVRRALTEGDGAHEDRAA